MLTFKTAKFKCARLSISLEATAFTRYFSGRKHDAEKLVTAMHTVLARTKAFLEGSMRSNGKSMAMTIRRARSCWTKGSALLPLN